jgi:hypothetical protein
MHVSEAMTPDVVSVSAKTLEKVSEPARSEE